MRLDRLVTLTVVAPASDPNDFGEIETETKTVEAWACRRYLGSSAALNSSRADFNITLLARWCIRWRDDVLPHGTGLTDDAGRRWRVTDIRELDDTYGRERFLELVCEHQPAKGLPFAPRS